MAKALRDNAGYNGQEIIVERPDGSRLHGLAHANPIHDESGALVGAVNVLVDITDRKRAEEALRRREAELTDFVENATVGLHWVGPDGTILWANRAELELLGYSREDYIGRNVAEFHADPSVIQDILTRLTNNEELHGYEARLRCKDGSIRHVLISSNVYREDGKFVHTRCFTRDITDRKRAEEALRDADRRKDEFLATLAHELRNPLAPVRTAVQILHLQGAATPKAAWALEVIERQMRHMTRLIDDLMDVSRISRNRLELRRERVELADVVRAAVETSRPVLEAGGQAFSVALPPEPIHLDADPTRLAQALSNLLNNAAKYTDRGGHVWLTAERRGGEAVVTVRDTGIGIPADLLPRLFEMFSQVARSLERSQGGLGIGLALVKRLVELHGGTVAAHSDGPGKGSEFVVRLPALVGELNGSAPADHASGGRTASALRILVVDDNRDAAVSLAMLLRITGHDVRTAHDGLEAVGAADEYRPDVAVLDVGLPRMNGCDVARRIRQQPWGRDMILIAVTGWGQDSDRRRSKDAGFDHHMVKPVNPAALLEILAALTRNGTVRDEPRTTATPA